MSNSKSEITPFEIGVCAALTVIGAAIANLDVKGRTKVADAAKDMMAGLPEDCSLAGGKSAHHIALESLIAGLLPERSQKPED